ncbi:MAG TPA: hypothetical protein PLP23_13000 [Panacibacter sp.]|nr:hypothetical protein [Panacibacter sp.]
MAINKNHEFEELDGVKCGIVEKNATAERVAFLKNILDYNQYKVVVVASPPPKAVPAKPAVAASEETPETIAEPAIETFTIGVTDVTFNPTNAIFGRLLKAPKGHVVTLAYWQQKENTPHDEVPYFDKK